MKTGFALALLASVSLLAVLAPTDRQGEEGFVTSPGGVRLHFRMAGTGRDTVVVIADGPGGHMGAIAPDLAALTRRHRVLFYDQRGSGSSSVPQTVELRLEDHVRDLDAIRMYIGIRKLRIVAHGWGAAIATQYAVAHLDHVARIALVAPIGVRRQWLDQAEYALDQRLDEPTRARLAAARADTGNAVAACSTIFAIERAVLAADSAGAAKVRGSPCTGPAAGVRFTLAQVIPATLRSLGSYDFRPSLAAVSVPVLVVHGEKDLTPAGSAEEWALALPDARLLVLPATGHFPHVEAAPAFAAALEAFLAGGWPEGAAPVRRVVAAR